MINILPIVRGIHWRITNRFRRQILKLIRFLWQTVPRVRVDALFVSVGIISGFRCGFHRAVLSESWIESHVFFAAFGLRSNVLPGFLSLQSDLDLTLSCFSASLPSQLSLPRRYDRRWWWDAHQCSWASPASLQLLPAYCILRLPAPAGLFFSRHWNSPAQRWFLFSWYFVFLACLFYNLVWSLIFMCVLKKEVW